MLAAGERRAREIERRAGLSVCFRLSDGLFTLFTLFHMTLGCVDGPRLESE